MAHRSTLVGWTPPRVRRTRQLAFVVAVGGLLVAWAMFLPWVGLTIGSVEPTCTQVANPAPVQMRSESGRVVSVAASGCISAYDSVQVDPLAQAPAYSSLPQGSLTQPTAARQAGLGPAATPHGAPTPEVKYGLPAETFWALAAAGLVVIGLLVRNALPFAVALLATKFSFAAFAVHRTALTWGLEGFGKEMIGVTVHQWAFMGVLFLSCAAALLVLKGNHQQRKLDGKPHPAVAALQLGASLLLRINAERLRESAAATKS